MYIKQEKQKGGFIAAIVSKQMLQVDIEWSTTGNPVSHQGGRIFSLFFLLIQEEKGEIVLNDQNFQ